MLIEICEEENMKMALHHYALMYTYSGDFLLQRLMCACAVGTLHLLLFFNDIFPFVFFIFNVGGMSVLTSLSFIKLKLEKKYPLLLPTFPITKQMRRKKHGQVLSP